MDNYIRQAKHATNARSVFDWIALVCLGGSLAFWMTLHWAWLSPPQLLSMQSIVAVVMGLIYSLVTPLLWSAMAPSTPAGMMLQRTQHRTFGFFAMIAATGFLTWHGWRLIWSWWLAQPSVGPTGEAMSLAISCLIGFVLVPALAWTATTPQKWMAAIEQAHQVKKLEMTQRGELAIIKARLLWAEQRAAMTFADMLPGERQEVFDTLKGLFMGINDQQQAIVRTLEISADLERDLMDDHEIADRLDYVAQTLDRDVGYGERGNPQALVSAAEQRSQAFVARPNASANAPANANANARTEDTRIRTNAHEFTNDLDSALAVAVRELGTTAWKRDRLMAVTGVKATKASELIKIWRAADIVVDISDQPNTYQFVEA